MLTRKGSQPRLNTEERGCEMGKAEYMIGRLVRFMGAAVSPVKRGESEMIDA